ncbi:hypothetical protein, partial [Staphylococcus haemolyticus]
KQKVRDSTGWQDSIKQNLSAITWIDAPENIAYQNTESQIEALKQQQATSNKALKQLDAQVKQLNKKYDTKNQQLVAHQETNKQIDALETAKKRQAELQADKPKFDQLEKQLTDLSWA